MYILSQKCINSIFNIVILFLDFRQSVSYNTDVIQPERCKQMHIIEQFIKPKKQNAALCEDGLFISEDFIAVVDGVTAKSDRLFDGMAGGRAAMSVTLDVLKETAAETTATELMHNINTAICKLYDGVPTGEAAVCIGIYSRYHRELWFVGDCQCLINGTAHTHDKLIDTELSEIRAKVINDAIKNGAIEKEIFENDIGRNKILPRLKQQHQFANRTDSPYGYPVLNGTELKFDITRYSLKDGDAVVLASDGYPKLFGSLTESEKYLEYILETDPLCCKQYKSTKGLQKGNLSFDDRTYIKFTV